MLINKLSVVGGVLVLAILSDTAIAQSDFYVFGTFGNTNSDISFDDQNRVSGGDDSYALGAGYTVNRNLSLEVAYEGFGNQNATTNCPPDFSCINLILPLTTEADLKAISLSVIGSIPLTDRFEVFGQVGIASWDVDYKGISSAFDDSGEDLLYGLGLSWSADDHWKIVAEYVKVDLDFDTASLGVRYHF